MSESQYLEKFKKLEGSKFKLAGGRILVEVLPKAEMKSAGGLIIAAPSSHKGIADMQRAVLGVVLMVGEGYTDNDGNDIPMEVKVGNVVVLNEFGVRYYSDFPGVKSYTENKLAMTSESEVQVKFESFEELKEFEVLMNS